MFNTVFLRAFNERELQSRNYFIRLLGYGPFSAPRGKNSGLDMETLRLKQMKDAFLSYSVLLPLVGEIVHGGEFVHLQSSV